MWILRYIVSVRLSGLGQYEEWRREQLYESVNISAGRSLDTDLLAQRVKGCVDFKPW